MDAHTPQPSEQPTVETAATPDRSADQVVPDEPRRPSSQPIAKCRNCHKLKSVRRRGLCSGCYRQSDIRRQFKTEFKACPQAPEDSDVTGERPKPEQPTGALPRTEDKIGALARRAAAKQDLWHQADAQIDSDRAFAERKGGGFNVRTLRPALPVRGRPEIRRTWQGQPVDRNTSGTNEEAPADQPAGAKEVTGLPASASAEGRPAAALRSGAALSRPAPAPLPLSDCVAPSAPVAAAGAPVPTAHG
jgi:hypothetical protein